MRPLSGRHAVGGFKITTLGRGGFASRVLRVVRHERGRHSRRASIADMPIQWASPPCSPWHRNPHLGGSSPAHSGTPAYVTDGDGRAGMRRARSAVLYCDSPSTGSVRGAQNGTFCRGLSSGGCASKFGGRPSKPERGNGMGRGPGRCCLGGEVLLEQVGADPEAGGTGNGAADRRLLWPLRAVLWTALLVVAFCGITAIVFNTSAPACGSGIGERRRRLAAR